MRKAARTVGGKAIGPVGYGLMSTIALGLILYGVNLQYPGLSMPWAPIAFPAATKILKAALDNGANFWNGVCLYSPNSSSSRIS